MTLSLRVLEVRDLNPLIRQLRLAAPDVATFREAGYPELTAMGWHAIYAPRHTPGDAVDRWARADTRMPQCRPRPMIRTPDT